MDDHEHVDRAAIRGLEPLVEAARRYPPEPPGARDQVMARVRMAAQEDARPRRVAVPSVAGVAEVWAWLTRPKTVRVTPLQGLGGLATVAVVLLVLALLVPRTGASPGAGPASRGPAIAASTRGAAAPGRAVQFVFVAPAASSVSLVGDFNDWQPQVTHLVRTGPSGVWSVDVHLSPGRHVYAFVVDDVWKADAFAPRAPDSDFGTPTSVVVVPGGSQS